MTARTVSERVPTGDAVPDTEGSREVETLKLRAGRVRAARDCVAREEPLEIRLGGASLAVVMRTPGFDAELALGFLVSERVIASHRDVAAVRHCEAADRPEAEGNVIRVLLRPGVRVDLDALRRNFLSNSSCGVCGRASIETALSDVPPIEDATRVRADALAGMMGALGTRQEIFSRTGGLHAVGLFSASGRMLAVREDVGRHNAVDKVIGWALRAERMPLVGHALMVSGRSSYEIVQKACFARIPIVAAVSAPTSLAVDFARAAGITLLGFARGGDFNVYSGDERILWEESPGRGHGGVSSA